MHPFVKKNHLIFKRDGDQWHLSSPKEAPVKKEKIDSMLSVFDYGFSREVNSNPSDLSEYGLDDPPIEFGIRISGEERFKTIQLGDNSPSDLNCYAKLKEQPNVYVVGILYKRELEEGLKLIAD